MLSSLPGYYEDEDEQGESGGGNGGGMVDIYVLYCAACDDDWDCQLPLALSKLRGPLGVGFG